MKLADKPCYPQTFNYVDKNGTEIIEMNTGLTFRERLIIALASNPSMAVFKDGDSNICYLASVATTQRIIGQADSLIKEMKNENK